MKRLCFTLSLLLIVLTVNTQNLISNGDFEDYRILNDGINYPGWNSNVLDKSGALVKDYNRLLLVSKEDTVTSIAGKKSLLSFHSDPRVFEYKLNKPLRNGRYYRLRFDYMPVAHKLPDFYVLKSFKEKIGDRILAKSGLEAFDQGKLDLYSNDFVELGVNGGGGIFAPKEDLHYLLIGNDKPLNSYCSSSLFALDARFGYAFDAISLVEISKEEYHRLRREGIELLKRPKQSAPNHPKKKNHGNDITKKLQNLQKQYPQEENIYKYYQHIHRAEYYLLQHNLKQAFSSYAKAFQYHRPFILDNANAYKCLRKFPGLMDQQALLYYYRANNASADDMKFRFESLAEYNPAYNNASLRELLLAEEYSAASYFDIDSTLLTELNMIDERDQTNNRQLDASALLEIVSSNLPDLLELYRNYPEISERTVHSDGMNAIYLTLLHNSRYPNADWIEPIYRDVKRGFFPAKKFADLIDSYYKNNYSQDAQTILECTNKIYMTETVYHLHGSFVYFDEMLSHQPKLNLALREEIYLDTYQSQLRKYFYNFKNAHKSGTFHLKVANSYDYFGIAKDGSISQDASTFDEEFIAEIEDLYFNYGLKIVTRKNNIRDLKITK